MQPNPQSYPGHHAQHLAPPPGPNAPAARAPTGGRRTGLIVLGVVLLLGGGVSAFSCTVWQESLEYTEKRGKEIKGDLAERRGADHPNGVAIEELEKELEKNRGFVTNAELYRNATGGGGAFGLLGGVAMIALGARKRRA